MLHALKHISPEQINQVIFWAGNPSTVTPPGIWLIFANDYMNLHQIELEKALYVRSILAMGIADSVIAVFNSKYTYWVKRPFMREPSIHTIMPTPNHPSYPAGHSTLSATAETLLSYFFPENSAKWKNLASIASEGRVWGGIHFPIDVEQGGLLGDKVGEAIISQLPYLPEE
ncbi:vanadium-dependent haloperoxidase [Legionella sp. km772]|uniref:vanadium-dependent haloperoxidase n=1 Tax=Legionella sp. km772 TaxID=2498111 RepID=UPI000F8D0472|nr:vanadium-dependent haloperoxidase [Legionella sp. km772]RUR04420.1 phosphatase PAP2 family protein [Legionella sp. km772]